MQPVFIVSVPPWGYLVCLERPSLPLRSCLVASLREAANHAVKLVLDWDREGVAYIDDEGNLSTHDPDRFLQQVEESS